MQVIYIHKPAKSTLAKYRKEGATVERIEFDWVKVITKP